MVLFFKILPLLTKMYVPEIEIGGSVERFVN